MWQQHHPSLAYVTFRFNKSGHIIPLAKKAITIFPCCQGQLRNHQKSWCLSVWWLYNAPSFACPGFTSSVLTTFLCSAAALSPGSTDMREKSTSYLTKNKKGKRIRRVNFPTCKTTENKDMMILTSWAVCLHSQVEVLNSELSEDALPPLSVISFLLTPPLPVSDIVLGFHRYCAADRSVSHSDAWSHCTSLVSHGCRIYMNTLPDILLLTHMLNVSVWGVWWKILTHLISIDKLLFTSQFPFWAGQAGWVGW